jgi:hypothetical protein
MMIEDIRVLATIKEGLSIYVSEDECQKMKLVGAAAVS